MSLWREAFKDTGDVGGTVTVPLHTLFGWERQQCLCTRGTCLRSSPDVRDVSVLLHLVACDETTRFPYKNEKVVDTRIEL